MMSTLFSGPAAPPVSEVEAFVYQDTAKPLSTATDGDVRLEASSASAPTQATPCISAEEISRLVAEARMEGRAEGTREAEAQLQEERSKQREGIARAIRDFETQRSE